VKSLPILISTTEEVILAGRLMGKRIMGKASFAELKDAEGGFKSVER
jgi:lysyl-tRNA synthetase class II